MKRVTAAAAVFAVFGIWGSTASAAGSLPLNQGPGAPLCEAQGGLVAATDASFYQCGIALETLRPNQLQTATHVCENAYGGELVTMRGGYVCFNYG